MATRRILVELLGDESSLNRAFGKGSKDAKHFDTTLKSVTRSTGGFSRGFLSGAGALSSFGGALALTSGSFFAGAGLVAGLKASVGAASTFEQTMNVLGQVTGGTADELARASELAKQLGADLSLPATSASDAAKAMLELAKGGLTLNQAMAATRGTLQLAAAAQTDVATAADETARALTTFGLSGKAAGQIADLLANGAQAATGDINDFALALSQSGTSAHQFGLTAQDTVAAITELAKAGILGSDAGTSLRVMLTRLLPTSKAAQREIQSLGIHVADASGHFRPFRDIVEQYAKALSTLSPKNRQFALQTIFGTDAQRAANIILGQGVKTFDALSVAVGKQGGAARAAAAKQKGFKGALDGFNSALQTTEVTIGTALLPVLTTYLRSLAAWLGTSREQEAIQRKVTTVVNDTTTAIKVIGDVIKTVDGITGGFVNTLKILLTIKVASSVVGWAGALDRFSGSAKKARGETDKLKKGFGQLVGFNPITIGIVIGVALNETKQVKDFRKFLQDNLSGGSHQKGGSATSKLNPFSSWVQILGAVKENLTNIKSFIAGDSDDLSKLQKQMDEVRAHATTTLRRGGKIPTGPVLNGPGGNVTDTTTTTRARKPLTAEQRNTFFDNDIARILLRGGLGNLGQQIAALNQASALITQRIAVTKDITRKQNLEDQLLQIAAQRKGLQQQQVQGFLDSLQFKVDEAAATNTLSDDLRALRNLQAALVQRIKVEGKTLALQQQLFAVRGQIAAAAQQQKDRAAFFALGLSPTGGERVPLASTLRKQLANVSDAVEGTFLDTKKTQSVLARIKAVLGSGVKGISAEVRSAIKDMLDGINQDLQNQGASAKFKHVSASAVINALGLNLTPEQKRKLEQAFSQVSASGKVPSKQSAAFGKAGANNPVVETTILMDGKQIARTTTKHQRQSSTHRAVARSGPYAGRN